MGKGFYFVSLVVALVSYVLCCTKLEPGARASGKEGDEYDTDDRKVYYSEVVVYGNVAGNATGDYPFKDTPGVYTIKFEVLCTYKGGDLPSIIYIAGIGNMNGELPFCPSAPLSGTHKDHVMFLKRTAKPEVFEIEFKPNFGKVDVVLDDLSIVCGLDLGADYDEVCEDFAPLSLEDGCESWTPKLVTEEPEQVTKKPVPDPIETTPAAKRTVTTKKAVDMNEKDKDQADQGYETKNSKTGEVRSDDKGNGATVSTATLLVSIATLLLVVLV